MYLELDDRTVLRNKRNEREYLLKFRIITKQYVAVQNNTLEGDKTVVFTCILLAELVVNDQLKSQKSTESLQL